MWYTLTGVLCVNVRGKRLDSVCRAGHAVYSTFLVGVVVCRLLEEILP
jgi:hypothetical protein